LLQALGEQSSREKFSAIPVAKEALTSAWDGPQMIDRGFRPRRLLFGSTGRVGDDRTLPLRFDFSSGMFGFHIPMAAADRLEIFAFGASPRRFGMTWTGSEGANRGGNRDAFPVWQAN